MLSGAKVEEHRTQLDRVLASESFRNAPTLRHLLSYLGEKSLCHQAEELKEYTVGIEACGKAPSYDPQKDAAVRVQIGRLRQKLQEYNQSEGLHDPIVLEIPKGRFTVEFSAREPAASVANALPAPPVQIPDATPAVQRRAAKSNWHARNVALVVLVLVLTVLAGWNVRMARKVTALEQELAANGNSELRSFWQPFFARGAQNVIVFGSPAFYASPTYDLFVRMYDAESPASARFRVIESKVGPFNGPRYDYASMGDAIAAQKLTSAFAMAGIPLRAVPAHLAVWNALQDANLIFVGAARMNPLLRRLPIQQDFELGQDNFIHNHNPQPGEQQVYATPSHRDAVSYAVVATYPGLQPDRSILVITAHSSPGVEGGVNFITSAGGLALVRDKLHLAPKQRRNFQMLLRVLSDKDLPIKTEYITHHMAP